MSPRKPAKRARASRRQPPKNAARKQQESALARVQRELAMLLMEEPARKAFATGKRRFLAERKVPTEAAALLARLDADDLAYFASRRHIDRHVALRADLPRTVRRVEACLGRLNAYFRVRPYAEDDPLAEAARFAVWVRAAHRQGSLPADVVDLARYELAVARLVRDVAPVSLPAQRKAAGPGIKAAHHHPLRSPGVVVLRLAHRVTESSDPAAPLARGTERIVLHRTAGDVLWYRVDRVDDELLRRADGATPRATWIAKSAKAARTSLEEAMDEADGLERHGLVSPHRHA